MNSGTFEALEASFERCRVATAAERRAIIGELERISPEAAVQLERMIDLPELAQDEAARLLRLAASEDVEADTAEPRTIGRYNLLGLLGEGGCGIVYLAEQPSPSHRLVALKIIKPGMDTRQVLTRFNDERQALALMDHPCVVSTIDAGSTDDGRPFVVMPLIPGLPITEFCNQEGFDIQDRVRVLVKVCRGIEHAHSKGVIHRDIKPGNILVARTHGQVLPRIIDFGLAKALAAPLTAHPTVTLTGQILGTPEYMSPEQAESTGTDVRSDVYSLGAVLYELLAGVPPIPSDVLRGCGAQSLVSAIRATLPAAPSHTSKARFRRELDWIVLKCLEKEPDRRYQSVGALADELDRFLAGDRVLAGPPARLYRAARWISKHRMLLLSGLVIVSTIAIGMISIERSRQRAERVARVTRSILTSVDPTVAQGRDPELLLMMLDESKAVLDDPILDPRVELELRETFAIANRTAGRLVETAAHAARADELIRELEGDTSTRRIRVLQLLMASNAIKVASDPTAVERNGKLFKLAAEIAEANAERDPLLPLRTKVDSRAIIGGYEREDLIATYRECEERLGPKSPYTIRMLRMLGRQLVDEYNVDGAEMIEEARQNAIEAFGPHHPMVHDSLSLEMLGATLTEGGYSRVVEMGTQRLPEAERVLGWRHPSLPLVYNNIGYAKLALGDPVSAVESLQRSLDIESRARRDDSGTALWIRANLLHAALVAGRMDLFAREEARAFEIEPASPSMPMQGYNSIIAELQAKGDTERVARWTTAREQRRNDAPN